MNTLYYSENIRRSRYVAKRLGIAGFMLALSACSGVHLHDAGAAKISAGLKTQSDALSFTEVIETERKNQSAMLDYELGVVGDFATTRRNLALKTLLSPSEDQSEIDLSSSLGQRIGERSSQIIGTMEYVNLLRSLNKIDTNWEQFQGQFTNIFKLIDMPVPSCTSALEINEKITQKYQKAAKRYRDIHNDDSPSDQDVLLDLRGYKSACDEALFEKIELWEKVHSEAPDSLFAGVLTAISLEKKNADKAKKAVKEKAGAYKAAKKAYDDAVKLGAPTDILKSLRGDLKKAREVLTSLVSANKYAAIVYGEERIDEVDGVLCTVDHLLFALADAAKEDEDEEKENNAADKGAPTCEGHSGDNIDKAKAVLAQFPAIMVELSKVNALSKAKPLQALLLEKERLVTEKRQVEANAKRVKRELALQYQQKTLYLRELTLLQEALSSLGLATKDFSVPITHKMMIKADATTLVARGQMVEALSYYLSTYTGPRRVLHENKYRLLAAQHTQVLDTSLASAKLWETTLKQMVALIDAYNQGGVKSEQIIQLLQALGLVATGVGVNS